MGSYPYAGLPPHYLTAAMALCCISTAGSSLDTLSAPTTDVMLQHSIRILACPESKVRVRHAWTRDPLL